MNATPYVTCVKAVHVSTMREASFVTVLTAWTSTANAAASVAWHQIHNQHPPALRDRFSTAYSAFRSLSSLATAQRERTTTRFWTPVSRTDPVRASAPMGSTLILIIRGALRFHSRNRARVQTVMIWRDKFALTSQDKVDILGLFPKCHYCSSSLFQLWKRTPFFFCQKERKKLNYLPLHPIYNDLPDIMTVVILILLIF